MKNNRWKVQVKDLRNRMKWVTVSVLTVSFCRLPFHFIDDLCFAEAFEFYVVPHVDFSFYLCLGCLREKSLPKPYVYLIYIYNCYIFLMNWPIIISWLSLFLITIFGLKLILSDISTATPAFFWFTLAWNVFLYPFTLSLCVYLNLKWIPCRHYIVWLFFFF